MDRPLPSNASSFPARLAAVSDGPERLFVRGQLPDGDRLWLGVVGSRAASGRARELAAEAAGLVCAESGVVVSGGALGVDAAAHRGALSAGGATVAVLAAGFGHLYPAAHRPLFADIAENGGSLVTPYAAAVPPRRFHFIRRNRILAGLCDAVLVIEAGRASGALYTAKAAQDYGRRLAAVPGSPGCEALIAAGAFAVRSMSELIDFARDRIEAAPPTRPSDDLENRVLAVLGPQPKTAEELARLVELPPREVDRALVGLELACLAMVTPGREYVRSPLGETIGS